MGLDIISSCSQIDSELSTFIYNIIRIIKIAVPIALVLFGMLDFGKGVMAGKEDEIKKGQNNFIKRLIAGAAVFLMITATQFVIKIIDKESSGAIWNCADLILNGRTNQQFTDDEEHEIDRSIIEECCKAAGGNVIKSNDNTSCYNPLMEEYDACMDAKRKEIYGGH